ncbi:MAG: IS630 family transposase [Desulfitobacteriia bacterium]
MPKRKYVIELSNKERMLLTKIVKTGKSPARVILRANILLHSDSTVAKPLSVAATADLFQTTPTTVQNVRTSYAESGLDGALYRKKRTVPPVKPKVDGSVEAHIIALCCSNPPEGYERWTVRLLADKCVELGYVDSISHMTVSRTPKKNEFKPHLKKCWCVPPQHNAAFVAAMEDVLEVYSRPYDETHPVVCMDEKPLQLLADARRKIKMVSGKAERVDNEYIRKGTCSIFLFTEPLSGWRRAEANEHRTRIDWALEIKWLLTEQYPLAEKVVLVMDNLNTHNIASLYETFSPKEALSLAKRLEIHYTPKHGSWLNIAEIELSALGRQCLGNRRIGNLQELNQELTSWYVDRNLRQKGVDWQFTTDDARIKLKRLYPIIK